MIGERWGGKAFLGAFPLSAWHLGALSAPLTATQYAATHTGHPLECWGNKSGHVCGIRLSTGSPVSHVGVKHLPNNRAKTVGRQTGRPTKTFQLNDKSFGRPAFNRFNQIPHEHFTKQTKCPHFLKNKGLGCTVCPTNASLGARQKKHYNITRTTRRGSTRRPHPKAEGKLMDNGQPRGRRV